MQRPPSGAKHKHRRTESMPDTLLKINGHRSSDHLSLTVGGDDVRDALSEEQDEAKTPTLSNDSGFDSLSLVCI